MFDTLLATIINWLEETISSMGALGLMGIMALESCNVPIPSEATLPFAGYLVSKGELNFHIAAWASAVGCLIGSIPSYYIGCFGGRKFIEKYGKYFFVTKEDLENADKWVEKYGDWAFFLCRMLPIIRTFISLPAGILRAKKKIFFPLTFLGSLIWSYALIKLGVELGEHLEDILPLWHKFDEIIIVSCFVLGCVYIYKHAKKLKKS
ncbi:DedA family protein [bacterium]|nr:DedA family protein [bacterium]